MIWKVRDELNVNLANGQLKAMLEANQQIVSKSSESKVGYKDHTHQHHTPL